MSIPWNVGSPIRCVVRSHPLSPSVSLALRCLKNGRERAGLATITAPQHAVETPHTRLSDNINSPSSQRPLTPEQQRFLDSALRVNHAGELAAVLIYSSQTPPLLRQHPHLKSLMDHMYSQEAGHFKTFSSLLAKHRIRPTAMYPVWTIAAKALGWGTAVMGREAAMACTEAVETEIGEHYNDQIRVLLEWAEKEKQEGRSLGNEFEVLLQDLRRIRDEELEHLDHAVEHDAKEAKPYELLTSVIRAGCRGAIWVTERV